LFEFLSDLIGPETSLVPGQIGRSGPVLITLNKYILQHLPTGLKNENLKQNLYYRAETRNQLKM
jgi:hypothetical protein